MLTDAHCHPYDLARVFPESENERNSLGVLAAASSCFLEEFVYKKKVPHNNTIISCSGIHPQLPAVKIADGNPLTEKTINHHLDIVQNLAKTSELAAIGECGFDLYNETYKETELLQDKIFDAHLEIALRYDLPLVLHIRRAMHKVFKLTEKLAKCKAVIFHTWPGTPEEAFSLLQRGVNAYFSFGNVIMLNHKKAIKSCALLPAERLLTETDAPYAPRRTEKFSSWADLPLILETAVALRTEAGNKIDSKGLEAQIEINFRKAFY